MWKEDQSKKTEKQKQNPTNIIMNGSYKQSYWADIPSEGFSGGEQAFCGFVCMCMDFFIINFFNTNNLP